MKILSNMILFLFFGFLVFGCGNSVTGENESADEWDNIQECFEFADALEDYQFDPESGVNPFLHISMHVIIENQLKSKEPIEAYQFYNSMRRKKLNHHDTIHLIGFILSPLIFQVLKRNEPFDNELYKRLLQKYKDKKPDKIYPAVEKELDFIFK